MRRVEAIGNLTARAEREGVTPLRRRVAPLDNLPLPLTRFIGREQELDQVRRLLETERLLTLTGPGGIGKTRLAVEVADELRERYRDGVWLIELAQLAEATLVAQAVAEPLGVRAEADVSVQQALLDFLRSRHLLLVFDNCEHLVEACALLVEAVLRACASVHILATSREPLHIAGEATWRVPTLAEAEAVRLFTDRALASSGLAITSANSNAVTQLCHQLDGMPLAIELAAARTGVLSVEQIALRLDNRFRLLVGGGRTAPARQQTLRATIDWSYELLPEPERRLLNCLSVFAGGWTLEAAEHVGADARTATDEVLELLARLVDRSLVQAEPGPNGQPRYRLLESVRDYAFEQLQASGETGAVQRRHAAYYGELANHAEAYVLWGANGLDWLARLDRELGNVRAALGWSLSGVGEPRAGLNLVGRLGHYWYTRADRAEGRAWLRRALSRFGAPGAGAEPDDRRAWAWALLWAGGLAHGQSDYDDAARLVGQALEVFEPLHDEHGIGWCLSFAGYIARARSELSSAAEALGGAIDAFARIEDEISQILPLAALGFTMCMLGDQPRASALLDRSADLARKTSARGRLAIVSIYIGQVAVIQGDVQRATAAFEEGLRLSREWDSAWGMAECLEGLAVVAGAEQHFDRAARLLGAAARLRETIGAPVHPVDRADHERTVSASLAALGSDAFDAAWAVGRATPLDDVIAFAVAEPETPARPGQLAQLTGREREVAVLIARGMSNRQIAETLVIAERTVTNHVEHIFDKLGFRSRAQVATWVTEQKLER